MAIPEREELLQRFGDRLRIARDELGLSQEELAMRASLDRSYVGSIERGERNVSLVNITKLADALNTSPGHLLRDILSQRINNQSNEAGDS
jgi:transcriptional regulator with XRE-family HTH domain